MIAMGEYFIKTTGHRISGTDLGKRKRTTETHNGTRDPRQKNMDGKPALVATSDGTLKMPMPITNPAMIMVRSKVLSLGLMMSVSAICYQK